MKYETKKQLAEKELKPVKHRGQNFLISEEYLQKIAGSLEIKSGELVVEVGPGTGNLTKELLKFGGEVIAIEKDANLLEILKTETMGKNLRIINEDILKFDETRLKMPYKLIGNIPYYLTGALIQKFLLSPNQPQAIILTIQKEVALRITAKPPEANFLSTLISFLAETELLFRISAENFWPKPKVDSAVIKITPKEPVEHPVLDKEKFIEFLRLAFKQPRQTLFNNLKRNNFVEKEPLEKIFIELKLDKKIRPQNLNLESFLKIFQTVKN